MLCYAQGRESLAGPASHNEFATVSICKTIYNVLQRLFLMFPKCLSLAKVEVLWPLDAELGPVNRAGIEVLNSQAIDGLGLIDYCVFGILSPLVGSGDNHTGSEERLPRCGEERINVLFRERVVWEIELALNGTVFARSTFLRNEVNAYVADVSLLWPVVPHPNVRKTVCVNRIKFEVTEDELLEAIP